jgi:hypothetical protein
MQMLPDLSERLAGLLERGIADMAAPDRDRLVAWLRLHARAELVDLPGDLTRWLARMPPDGMVAQYNRVRRLIRDCEHDICEEGC